MRSNGWLVYFVAVLVLLAALAHTFTNRRALNRRLYDQLIASGLRDDRYRAKLQAYADLRKSIDPRPLCLEPPFRDDCINVLVVDSVSEDAPKGRGFEPWLRDLRLNALALPPNLILVDGRLLDFLTVAMGDALTANTARMLADGANPQSLRTALAHASFAEFANLAEFFVPGSSSFTDARPIWERAKNELESENGGGAVSEIVRPYMSIILAILLEHEIAHLEASRGPYWALSIRTVLARSAAPLIYREEVRADGVALDRAYRLADSFRTRNTPAELRPFVQDLVISRLPFLVYAGFLQDLSLYDGLEGFRGLPARDWVLSFFHKNCDDEPELVLLPFNAQARVAFAGRKSLPLLTKDEFSALRSRLAHADLAQTHRHNLIRAEEILARSMLEREFIEVQNPKQSDYIRALLENQPLKAFTDKSEFVPIPGTNIDQLLEGAQKLINVERAVTCPLEQCYVGTFSNNDGFFEVIGTARQVVRIRLDYNMHPPWGIPAGDELARKQSHEAYTLSAAQMLGLFRLIGQGKASQNTMLMAGYLRLPIFHCGLGSLEVGEAGILYRLESLSRPGWIEITVRAAKAGETGRAEEFVPW